MKYSERILSLVLFGMTFWWANKMYSYFFGVTVADQIGMILILLLSNFLVSQIKYRESDIHWFVTGLGMALPMLLYPILVRAISISDDSWIIVPIFLLTSGATIAFQRQAIHLGLLLIAFVIVFFLPYGFDESQKQFYDRLEQSIETRKGRIQLAGWKNDYWLYYNDQLQFATLDKKMFQEAYTRPIMQFADVGDQVLLIGGDNGMVEDELSRSNRAIDLTILPLDEAFYQWVRRERRLSISEYTRKKTNLNTDFFHYLNSNEGEYDVIILDLPDPVNLDYSQYYSLEFYTACMKAMKTDGFLVTQTGDLFKNTQKAFNAWETIKQAGFEVLPYQCQVPTVGHWTWVVGAKSMTTIDMKAILSNVKEQGRWWNQEAMDYMMSFGKHTYLSSTASNIVRLNKPQ